MKFWIGLFFILGFGVGYGGYLLWEYDRIAVADRDKTVDTREVLGGRAIRTPTETPLGMIKYEGGFMTFMYPAKAKKHDLKKADKSILERIDLEIDNPRLSIVATASELPDARNVDEIPGVIARRNQKEKYTERQTVVGVEKNPVFTNEDGREKIVFVMYKGRVYTLAVYGSDARAVAELWAKILPTFHFI